MPVINCIRKVLVLLFAGIVAGDKVVGATQYIWNTLFSFHLCSV